MMSKKFLILFFLGISTLMVSCGLSEEEMDATATQFALNIFATQTADAPTITPTPSPTFTPTSTPSPTLTPTITLTPTRDLNTLYAGPWHRLNPDPTNPTAEHQVYDCQGGEEWTCILSTETESELSFKSSQGSGLFEGKSIPDWNCPNWLTAAICRSAILVISGSTLFESPGSSLRLDIEHIVVEIGENQILYEVLDNRFACPWFRSFDEALAANPFPYNRDCLQP